jgi:D-beta-D-heptose 7-phosphate kinase/D-beta-D-heptose 1-phosphate adenosyltransferase
LLIASLAVVDAVVIFMRRYASGIDTSAPPDVLVKGGDYRIEDIAGATDVLSWGGHVFINPIVPGFSLRPYHKIHGDSLSMAG